MTTLTLLTQQSLSCLYVRGRCHGHLENLLLESRHRMLLILKNLLHLSDNGFKHPNLVVEQMDDVFLNRVIRRQMVHLYIVLLSQPMNSSNPLLQAHRVPGKIEVDHMVTKLQIDALTTAKILSEYTGTPVSVDETLRERGFGSAEGMPRSQADELYPDGAPDAEPLDSIDARAQDFLNRIIRNNAKGRFVCVTHGGFVRAVMRVLFSQQVGSPPNTSVTSLAFANGRWILREFGATPHL